MHQLMRAHTRTHAHSHTDSTHSCRRASTHTQTLTHSLTHAQKQVKFVCVCKRVIMSEWSVVSDNELVWAIANKHIDITQQRFGHTTIHS